MNDDDCPKCDKCSVPITTGMLALFCPHGRNCEFVETDDDWHTVEELRQELSIERVALPGSTANGVKGPKND